MTGLFKKTLFIIVKIIVVPAIAVVCVWTAFQIAGGEIVSLYQGPGILEWLGNIYFDFNFGEAGVWTLSGERTAGYIWKAIGKTGAVTLLAVLILTAVSLCWTYVTWKYPFSILTRSASMGIRFFSSWPILIGAIFMAVATKGQVFSSLIMPALVLAVCDNNLNDFRDNLNDEIKAVLKSEYAVSAMGQGRSFLRNLGPELSWKVLSFIASRFPVLVSGIIILEFYFNINGIYFFLKVFYEARDLNAILGITFLVSILMTAWSSMFIFVHALIDPRQR